MYEHVLNGSQAASMNESTFSAGCRGADHLVGGEKYFKNSDTCSSLATASTLIDVTKFVLRMGWPEQLMGLLSTFKNSLYYRPAQKSTYHVFLYNYYLKRDTTCDALHFISSSHSMNETNI